MRETLLLVNNFADSLDQLAESIHVVVASGLDLVDHMESTDDKETPSPKDLLKELVS